jgi:hypothetical protein
MPDHFPCAAAAPLPNEVMRAVMRSFDDGTPPFMAHRAVPAGPAVVPARRPRPSRSRARPAARR